MRSGEPDQR